jgi:hypothetical protein
VFGNEKESQGMLREITKIAMVGFSGQVVVVISRNDAFATRGIFREWEQISCTRLVRELRDEEGSITTKRFLGGLK